MDIWNNQMSLQLIEEYHKQPCLWDPKHFQYHSKDEKADAWKVLSQTFRIDIENIRKKMDSLLGSYRREKSRTKKSSGYKSKWFAFEAMQFLMDRYDTTNALNMENDAAESSNSNWDNSLMDNDNNIKEYEEPELVVPRQIPEASRKTSDPLLTKGGRISNDQVAPNTLSSSLTLTDECYIYGMHVSNKLRTYSAKTRALVEHRIGNILFEADMSKHESASVIRTDTRSSLEDLPIVNLTYKIENCE